MIKGEKVKTAILIDGGFFLKRYAKLFTNGNKHNPATIAENMYHMAMRHLNQRKCIHRPELYRILYYDCKPFTETAHHPITGKVVDFSKTTVAKDRLVFFNELKKKRKVALRLGELRPTWQWDIKPYKKKQLIAGKITVKELQENDVIYILNQKGVDIKIGLDIASLALKKMVDQIVLVSGDMDFVPASKMARRNGIDFILDPMWNNISPSLHEHIDGLQSTSENPKKKFPTGKYPYII